MRSLDLVVSSPTPSPTPGSCLSDKDLDIMCFNLFPFSKVAYTCLRKDKAKGQTGQQRIAKLTDEQKANIESMASPAEMDYAERKRQYAAMRRAIHKSAEPALLAKFQLSTDGDRPGSQFIRCHMI